MNARHDYLCENGHLVEIASPFGLAPDMYKPCPTEEGAQMEWVPPLVRAIFQPTIGRDSGWYEQDYGKRATEDLTPDGKMARLIAAGTIADPFKEYDDGVRDGTIAPYMGVPNADEILG